MVAVNFIFVVVVVIVVFYVVFLVVVLLQMLLVSNNQRYQITPMELSASKRKLMIFSE